MKSNIAYSGKVHFAKPSNKPITDEMIVRVGANIICNKLIRLGWEISGIIYEAQSATFVYRENNERNILNDLASWNYVAEDVKAGQSVTVIINEHDFAL